MDFVGDDIAYAAGVSDWQSCGEGRVRTSYENFSSGKDSQISGNICKFEVEDCKFWTWEPEENMCRFKGSDSGYTKHNGTVSGQVCCPTEESGACC